MFLLFPIIFIILSGILGYKLVRFIPIELDRGEDVAVGLPLGLVVVCEINFILAYLIGFSQYSIAASMILVSAVILFLLIKKSTKNQLEGNLIRSWPFWAIFLTIGIYIIFVLSTKILNPDESGNLMVGPPALYGDTALHASYISKIATGKFPPENPIYAGVNLVYPYMNNFLSAILVKLGMSLRLSFVIPQIFFVVGFITLFVKLAKNFVNNLGVFSAISSWFLGWGIGFYFFFQNWLHGVSFIQFSQIVGDLTHNDKYHLNLHNVITGMILPERTFLPGLFLGLVIANIFVPKKLDGIKQIIVTAIILGILPMWHTHTFLFFSLSSFIWFFIWVEGTIDENIKKTFIFFTTVVVLSLPIYIVSLKQVSGGHFITFIMGWMAGNENVIIYWFKNSFLIIPAAILGLFLMPKGKQLFFVPALLIFVLANLISFQPWEWDNIKLIAWSLLFLSVCASSFYMWLFKRNVLLKSAAVFLFIVSILSGAYAIRIPISGSYILYDSDDVDLANWVKVNTKRDDVLLTNTIHNDPVSGLAGRSIYIGYPGYLWVHGIQYSRREEQDKQVLSGDFSQIKNLEVPISYIVFTLPVSNFRNYDVSNKNTVEEVFRNKKYLVLKML